MFGWLFRKKKRERPLSPLPSFFVEVDPHNGEVLVSASWPKPTNENDMAALIKAYTHLLLLLDSSRLTGVFQHAISVYGENHDDVVTATSVIATYSNHVKTHSKQEEGDEDKPIVQPIHAFRS
jgi:hypothetical protein